MSDPARADVMIARSELPNDIRGGTRVNERSSRRHQRVKGVRAQRLCSCLLCFAFLFLLWPRAVTNRSDDTQAAGRRPGGATTIDTAVSRSAASSERNWRRR